MTKKQFKHNFLKGMGSALLALQSCDKPEKYRDTVLYGCLHDTMYDAQCEGDRGWYLYQAIKIVGDEESVEKAVIQKFFRITWRHWLFVQLTAILYHYAKDGSENARVALYGKYMELFDYLSCKRKLEGVIPQADMFRWLCVWLTSLDGWSAFKKIVREISENLLPKNADYFFDEWFYDNAKSKFGGKRVENYLQKQAEKSHFMLAYYEKAKAWDNYIAGDNRPIPTLEQILDETDGQEFHGRGLSMRFAKNADLSDLEKLAQAAINEPDINRKSELLWGFRRRAYPFPEQLVLEWSKSEHEGLREIAFYIMGNNSSQQAHDYAVSLIQNKIDIQNGLFLLSKKYQPQDEELLFTTIQDIQQNCDENEFHSAAMDIETVLSSVRQKPKTDILTYLYYQTPCSCCRYRIVQLMRKKKVLSENILQECRFDSNSDIREFAERIIKSRKISNKSC